MEMDRMEIQKHLQKPRFLTLPPEVHEQIIRHCGVRDVCSIILVNHYLHNVVKSRFRDILISACQNGNESSKASYLIQIDYLEDIDQLYYFPYDDQYALWKVVRNIHRLDQFRNVVIKALRWHLSPSSREINKRRAVWVSFFQC